uniref:Uncharacterized protein n=1 Tax=Glossina brevipalpis TaxID=37001 RepID=A0A1A9WTR4_9MUSC
MQIKVERLFDCSVVMLNEFHCVKIRSEGKTLANINGLLSLRNHFVILITLERQTKKTKCISVRSTLDHVFKYCTPANAVLHVLISENFQRAALSCYDNSDHNPVVNHKFLNPFLFLFFSIFSCFFLFFFSSLF